MEAVSHVYAAPSIVLAHCVPFAVAIAAGYANILAPATVSPSAKAVMSAISTPAATAVPCIVAPSSSIASNCHL